MASVLTYTIIANATEKVDSYITTANGLYNELEGVLSTLLASNFNGDAADGYNAFFKEKITPALTDNLTTPASSLTAGIRSILESIQTQLLDTVDPQLGEANRNPGA
ncbi:MAG: hypothetical protein E7573_11615 [Ruminococcaceae bacterium]|nr:hypothetical protein [Oscillospiraceae bacterium]MBR3595926.1 hypothetical protein [Clostridia bacterium]